MTQKLRFTIWHLLAITLLVGAILCWYRIGDQFDPELAKNVPLVVRVKLLESRGGSKYQWSSVQVLRVYKNETDEEIPKELSVASYGWSSGVPAGRSTLYLVRYNEGRPEFGYKLNEPYMRTGTSLGVSHQSHSE